MYAYVRQIKCGLPYDPLLLSQVRVEATHSELHVTLVNDVNQHLNKVETRATKGLWLKCTHKALPEMKLTISPPIESFVTGPMNRKAGVRKADTRGLSAFERNDRELESESCVSPLA